MSIEEKKGKRKELYLIINFELESSIRCSVLNMCNIIMQHKYIFISICYLIISHILAYLNNEYCNFFGERETQGKRAVE